MEEADRVITYLKNTRTLAIEYNGREEYFIQWSRDSSDSPDEVLQVASDAAYADDPDTRRSSEGYLIQLYGRPTDWRASNLTYEGSPRLLGIQTALSLLLSGKGYSQTFSQNFPQHPGRVMLYIIRHCSWKALQLLLKNGEPNLSYFGISFFGHRNKNALPGVLKDHL
ncbi:hypothetical protein VTO42DRAFT_1250 [Malbranchea cinnamomea]